MRILYAHNYMRIFELGARLADRNSTQAAVRAVSPSKTTARRLVGAQGNFCPPHPGTEIDEPPRLGSGFHPTASSMDFSLALTDIDGDAVRQAILLPLRAYNASKAGTSKGRPLVVFLLESSGLVRARRGRPRRPQLSRKRVRGAVQGHRADELVRCAPLPTNEPE